MPNPEVESLLRERIDDLSTCLLMTDPGETGNAHPEVVLAALAQISGQADASGYGETARIANDLAVAFEQGSESQTSLAELQEGLTRLQEALACPPAGLRAGPAAGAAAAETPPAAYSLADDPELVADFITESREHLTTIEQRILVLEKEPNHPEAINSIFRGFHTIKGLAGFLEYAPIQEIAHNVETALNLAREGTLSVTTAVIDVILESVDYLSRSISGIEAGTGCVPGLGHDGLLKRIRALMAANPSGETPEAAPAAQKEVPGFDTPEPEAEQRIAATKKLAAAETFSVRVDTAKLDYLVDMVSETVIAQSMVRHNRDAGRRPPIPPCSAIWSSWLV